MARIRVMSPVGEVTHERIVVPPLFVAGGPGKHSAVVPNCTFSRAVARPIRP